MGLPIFMKLFVIARFAAEIFFPQRGKHSRKVWIGGELIWRKLCGCSIALHYECFSFGTESG
jgi:hypothetical protein